MLAKIRIDSDGNILFYSEKGKYHRLDGGHAIECANGSKKYWIVNGKLHRLNGPAIECTDGRKEWWINDIEYTEEEFNKIVGEI